MKQYFSFSFSEVEDNGRNPEMTSVNSPIDGNLPDGVQRTASKLHMWFVKQGTTPTETTMLRVSKNNSQAVYLKCYRKRSDRVSSPSPTTINE